MIAIILIKLIRLYQLVISPITPACCRFYPSCSEYAIEAIKSYGIYQGVWLAVRRILKCNPYGGAGLDPVPTKGEKADSNCQNQN
jgi:putative membrane protein insertion efficiency factor